MPLDPHDETELDPADLVEEGPSAVSPGASARDRRRPPVPKPLSRAPEAPSAPPASRAPAAAPPAAPVPSRPAPPPLPPSQAPGPSPSVLPRKPPPLPAASVAPLPSAAPPSPGGPETPEAAVGASPAPREAPRPTATVLASPARGFAIVLPFAPVAAPTSRPVPDEFSPDVAIADVRKRAESIANGDRTGLSRARFELAMLLEIAKGDLPAAIAEHRAAHAILPALLAPIAAARRLTPLRPVGPALALLDAELRAPLPPTARAERLLELGRLLGAGGALPEKACQAYRDLLALSPKHPGALRGLETALYALPRGTETAPQVEAIASHLESMAATFRAEAKLSAWLEIERGQYLDRIGRGEAARAAFDSAIELDGGLGPVRDAFTSHLLVRGHVEALVQAWSSEASLEGDAPRAARLLYAAGRLASERLGQTPLAIELHERVAALPQATTFTRRTALRELSRLYEAIGNVRAAVATDTKRLASAREPEKLFLHRRLAFGYASLGEHASVASHAQRVLALEPDDEPVRTLLDRALVALGQHEQRVAWLTAQASRTSSPPARVELLLSAARIAEDDMRRADLALVTLRAAWAVDPTNPDTSDAIARLLTPGTPPSVADPGDPSRVRARIDFVSEAAAAATDPERKIAHLERLAHIWEDEVRAPERALRIYQEILATSPGRRGAILGIQRCAARAGDAGELLRALLLEADGTTDATSQRALLLRAAEVAERKLNDTETALELLQRILSRNAGDTGALRAAFRMYERTARHAEALAQLRLLLGHARRGAASYPIQAEIARFLEDKTQRAAEALTAWHEGHRLDPSNPAPRTEIRRILEATGDHQGLAEDLSALATSAADPADRVELLVEAAEIWDDRLDQPERAIPLLAQARALLPDERSIAERLDRAYARSGKTAERIALLEGAPEDDAGARFALAALLAEGPDAAKSLPLLARLAEDRRTSAAALRTWERAARRANLGPELDAALRAQVECFETRDAKLGSLYELVALEEYRGVSAADDEPSAPDLLHEFVANDLQYHDRVLREHGLGPGLARGPAVVASLRALATMSPEPLQAGSFQLAAGMLLEASPSQGSDSNREALVCYLAALDDWPECLTAARGARRLALRLDDRAALALAAAALGTLETSPQIRSERLLEAADGPLVQQAAPRAAELACRALAEDPNSARATDAVVAALGRGLDTGRAVEALRSALDRATAPEPSARLAAALAFIAYRYLEDPTVALEALRRARKRAPGHVGNLLSLAEASAALGLYAEAAEAATSAIGITRDPDERLRAALTLAEAHALAPVSREAARREAAEAEQLAQQSARPGAAPWARLGAVYRALGDLENAGRVLERAAMVDDQDPRLLDQLVRVFETGSDGSARLAATLGRIVASAEEQNRPPRAAWVALLGRLEAVALGKREEGLRRLRQAVRLTPEEPELYDAIVAAYGDARVDAAREVAALLPELGKANATREQICRILTIVARASELGGEETAAAAAAELAAFLGDTSSARVRSELPANVPVGGCLGRDAIVRELLGEPNQAPLLDAAAALSDTATKLIKIDAAALDISDSDRLQARDPHPERALADRMARAFGDLRFDLYVNAAVAVPRVVPGDPPSLVLPRGYGELAENERAAGLARLLTYVALDVPWLDELSDEDLDGMLFGALRLGFEQWGAGQLTARADAAAEAWRTRLAKAGGRKLRRSFEELAHRVLPQPDASGLRRAVRAAALRAAFTLTGDLASTLSHALRIHRELSQTPPDRWARALFEQPVTRSLILFALSEASAPLCRAARDSGR